MCEKSVDMERNVRYNGGSLSKSLFTTSTKRKRKRGSIEVAYKGFKLLTQAL